MRGRNCPFTSTTSIPFTQPIQALRRNAFVDNNHINPCINDLCRLERLNLLESVTTIIRSATSHPAVEARLVFVVRTHATPIGIDGANAREQKIEVIIL